MAANLEKTVKEARFERGQVDARRGFSPSEGSQDYLEGYAKEFNQTHKIVYKHK